MTAQTWTSLEQTCIIALTQGQAPLFANIPANFTAQFAQATSYAENRIYREIPMLNDRVFSTSPATVTSAGTRQLAATAINPTGTMLVPEQFGFVTPANSATGTWVSYNRVSLDFIVRTWPNTTVTVAPTSATNYGLYWAMQDDQTIVFAPPVDSTYYAFLVGFYALDPISAANPSTYLSINYPELLTAGCMVFLTGALTRNFGAQQDEPRSAVSWETQFTELLASARDQEIRLRGMRPNVPMMPMAPKPGAP